MSPCVLALMSFSRGFVNVGKSHVYFPLVTMIACSSTLLRAGVRDWNEEFQQLREREYEHGTHTAESTAKELDR